MLKVREIIKLQVYYDGYGWSDKQTYNDNIVEVQKVPMKAKEYNWNWYETFEENPEDNGIDTKIIIEFYTEDAEPGYDEPIATFSKLESELWEERNYNNYTKGGLFMSKGIYSLEVLEENGFMPVSKEDAKTIQNTANKEIEIYIDQFGRVWNSGDIYIADVKSI